MLHILSRMRVCPCACNFFRMLYQSKIAIISLGGRARGGFCMAGGVKQGCLSSMLLFVLAADWLSRWTRFTASSHIDTISAYADDLCFGFPGARRSLGPLLALLTQLEDIAGLALTFKKCQILVVGPIDVGLLRGSVRVLKGDFTRTPVLDAVKYLGICIGPGAVRLARSEACPTFQERVSATRQLRFGLARSALAFRVMRVYEVSALLVHACKGVAMCLTAGPRNAISYAMCTQLSAIHLPIEFQDVVTLSRDVCLRYTIRSGSVGAPTCHLEALGDEPDHVFIRMAVAGGQHPPWRPVVPEKRLCRLPPGCPNCSRLYIACSGPMILRGEMFKASCPDAFVSGFPWPSKLMPI
eukprot:1700019-Pyramimonas_sp.AAC.1